MSLFFVRDCFERCFERKKTLIVFGAIYLLGAILGMCFIRTPAVYDYHLGLCVRYMDRVCFSDRNIFLIFLERMCGCTLLLALMIASGVHFAALLVPPGILLYRAYTLGGSLIIFFSVYRATGALVVLVLYLPVHLLIDAVLIAATVVSCGRAHRFCFCRTDFTLLGLDFAAFFLLIAAICLVEAVLLLAVFHPIGTII